MTGGSREERPARRGPPEGRPPGPSHPAAPRATAPAGRRPPPGREPGRPPADLPPGAWDLIGEAVVVCDPSGVVSGHNRAARTFFPRLRAGEKLSGPAAGPLAGAAERGEESFDAPFAGRRLVGHRTVVEGRTVWLVRDDSAVREREDALLAERSRSAFLARVRGEVAASLHHTRAARALVRAAVPELARTAALLLPPRGPRVPWHLAGPGSAEYSGEVPVQTLDRTPRVAAALSGLDPRLVPCPRQELDALHVITGRLPPGDGKDGEALLVPLSGSGDPAGALMLLGPGRSAAAPGGRGTDVELASRFAAQAGTALAAADFYTRQTRTTEALHAGLEPQPLPEAVPGVRLGAAYRPARGALDIGGDYYQVCRRSGGGVEFFLGDVCGKGVEAAVLTGRVRQTMRALTLVERRPVRVLELLNTVMLEAGEPRFTTLVTGSARPHREGGLDVVVAGGGHLDPLVLRRDGRVEPVEIGGTLVGVLPDPVFARERVLLAPGELLLLYSDGVTEARGGPTGSGMFGEERLVKQLSACGGMPAGAVAERVELLVSEWLGEREVSDDIAVLAVQAAPPSAEAHLSRAHPVGERIKEEGR